MPLFTLKTEYRIATANIFRPIFFINSFQKEVRKAGLFMVFSWEKGCSLLQHEIITRASTVLPPLLSGNIYNCLDRRKVEMLNYFRLVKKA